MIPGIPLADVRVSRRSLLGLAQNNPDCVRGAVICQEDGRAAADGFAVDFDGLDALADVVGVEDFNFVAAGVIAEGQVIVRPVAGDAGVHEKRGSAQAKSENPFNARAVHPSRGAGVPGPAAAAGVRLHRINIARQNVGFYFITLDVGACTAMMNGFSMPKSSPALSPSPKAAKASTAHTAA